MGTQALAQFIAQFIVGRLLMPMPRAALHVLVVRYVACSDAGLVAILLWRDPRHSTAADETGAAMKDLSRRMVGDMMLQALALAAMLVVAAMAFYVR